jgi:hypothetical protein
MVHYRFVQENEDVARDYSKKLEEALKDTNPKLIINCDETSSKRCDSREKVFGERGVPTQVFHKDTTQAITIGTGVTASGERLPMLLIYPVAYYKSYMMECLEPLGEEAKKTVIITNGRGFMTKITFCHYLEKVVLPYVEAKREEEGMGNQRALLIVDQHGSRETLTALKLLYDHNIHILGLPPHTSHLFQPLDQHPFQQFKRVLKTKLREAGTITYSNIAAIVFSALSNALTPTTIQHSFRDVGIYPFNKDLILKKPCRSNPPSDLNTNSAVCIFLFFICFGSFCGMYVCVHTHICFFGPKQQEEMEASTRTSFQFESSTDSENSDDIEIQALESEIESLESEISQRRERLQIAIEKRTKRKIARAKRKAHAEIERFGDELENAYRKLDTFIRDSAANEIMDTRMREREVNL